MAAIQDLSLLLQKMEPELNTGAYVFCTVPSSDTFPRKDIIAEIREKEGVTVVLSQQTADQWNLPYDFVASWITLTIHSSLESVGLTAAFATALAEEGISCNVIAGFYHDHLFVSQTDEVRAMQVLRQLSEKSSQK